MISNAVLLFVIGYFCFVVLALYRSHHLHPFPPAMGRLRRGEIITWGNEGEKGKKKET